MKPLEVWTCQRAENFEKKFIILSNKLSILVKLILDKKITRENIKKLYWPFLNKLHSSAILVLLTCQHLPTCTRWLFQYDIFQQVFQFSVPFLLEIYFSLGKRKELGLSIMYLRTDFFYIFRTGLRVRRMGTHFVDRAFSAASPRSWNSLPPVIRVADSVDSFKAQLKTHLFAKAYPN